MIKNNQNEQLIKIGNWISPRLERYESAICLILAAALLLRISTNLPTGIVITLSFTILAMMYFFNAFSSIEDENAGGMEQFIKVLAGISSSSGLMGILYTLQNWPGSNLMLMSGSIASMISLVFMYIIKSRNPDLKVFTSRMILRTFLIAALGLALYFTPKETLKKSGLVKEVNIERTE